MSMSIPRASLTFIHKALQRTVETNVSGLHSSQEIAGPHPFGATVAKTRLSIRWQPPSIMPPSQKKPAMVLIPFSPIIRLIVEHLSFPYGKQKSIHLSI
jgi:hypothetical protein